MIKSQTTQEFGISPMPTPDKRRPGCRVMVSLADFSFAEIPAIGTTLGDSGLNITKQNATWLNHVFAGVEDGPRGWIYFVFNPAISDSATPFRSYPTTEDYSWPAVLKDLGSIMKRVVTNGDQNNYFLGSRYAYIEGVKVATKVLVEEFLSSTPFPDTFIEGEEPIPLPIDAKVYDGRISFPPCLHPAIEITPRYESSYGGASYAGVIYFEDHLPQNSTLDFSSVQKFPRTNFLSWSVFTKPAEVNVTNSDMYYAIKKTYFPPNVNLFTIQ
jgi:hypothetical protein